MRILLIDDEIVALTKLELMLAHMGVCDRAANGIEATDCFVKAIDDNQPYDLVTIDIELPDITGIDLLNRFCQLERKNAIAPAKKIMVTSHSQVDYVVKVHNQCDAFVVKPLRKATLLEKINQLYPPEKRAS